MMEFISRYSGLCAIVVYSLILWLILSISSARKKKSREPVRTVKPAIPAQRLDESNEEATVAALVAAIECRNEHHKNVRIVSVREVKA